MKYAVLESGGKQYFAREGATVEVDRLPHPVGETVDFHDILLLADENGVKVGSPTVMEAQVKGRVVAHFKGPKVRVFRYIPKERYRKRKGHRQAYTRIQIEQIVSAGVEERPARRARSEESEPEKKPRSKSATAKRERPAAAQKSRD